MPTRTPPEHEAFGIAYTILQPPLSALPAKYHAPISLLIHSLSTGYTAYEIARLLGMDNNESKLALLLGITHDIHQKFIDDGLATLRTVKQYLREKLDEVGYGEYYRYIDDSLERDSCGKGKPIRGLPKELALTCHIGDMIQGKLEGISLFFWLKEKVKELDPGLTTRFYSIMIPQPFARAYAMLRIYEKHIKNTDHVALSSPWGLYVITYEDELPETLEVSWDELRIDPIIEFEEILEVEEAKKSAKLDGITISGDEAKNRLWSRFARMFYKKDSLKGLQPIYPKLPVETKGLFINIEFTDIEFTRLDPGNTNLCGLCGLPHPKDVSLPITMYGTKQGIKIAGIKVTPEKWNRFLPAHLKVKTWDSKGPWNHGIGMCPLCTLDAVAVRQLGVQKTAGYITLSVSKPIPVGLLNMLSLFLEKRSDLARNPNRWDKLTSVGAGTSIVDYVSSSVFTGTNSAPRTESMFDGGELVGIGALLSLGLYPIKYFQSIDTTLPDRLLSTSTTFRVLDFPITSKRYSHLIPWVTKLVEEAGKHKRNETIGFLMDKPEHAPLHLLTLNKQVYDHVRLLMVRIGVRA